MSNDTSYSAYWENVQCLANYALESHREDDTDIGEAITNAIDGNWWTIYTHAATAALQHCNNPNAWFEEISEEPPSVNNYCELVTILAAYALMEDVQTTLADELP